MTARCTYVLLTALLFAVSTPHQSVAQESDSLYLRIMEELQSLKEDHSDLKNRLGGLAAGLATIRQEINGIRLALGDSSGGLTGERRPRVVARQAAEPGTFNTAVLKLPGESEKGEAGARLVMVEFSDFECPFCARYATGTLPALIDEYVETGKLRYVFRHYPASFHANARDAARAAICAERQGHFWAMHDTLFLHRDALQREHLRTYAEVMDLDGDVFAACMDDPTVDERIDRDMAAAREVGFRGTPHFGLGYADADGSSVLITQLISGAKPLEEFQLVIDQMLADPPAGE